MYRCMHGRGLSLSVILCSQEMNREGKSFDRRANIGQIGPQWHVEIQGQGRSALPGFKLGGLECICSERFPSKTHWNSSLRDGERHRAGSAGRATTGLPTIRRWLTSGAKEAARRDPGSFWPIRSARGHLEILETEFTTYGCVDLSRCQGSWRGGGKLLVGHWCPAGWGRRLGFWP